MKRKHIVIALVAGLIWFIHTLNPAFDEHKEAILPAVEAESEVWDDLEYKDYFLVSFTRAERGTMVSVGLCNYIRVIDEEWSETQPAAAAQ